MRRDPELVRRLLLEIETLPYPNQYTSFNWPEYSTDDIAHHIEIMNEDGLIEAFSNKYSCFDEWNEVRLCWRGHELLDLARNQEQWEAALARMEAEKLGMNFEVLRRLLIKQAVNTLDGA